MAKVYGTARQVVVWLGPESTDSRLALELTSWFDRWYRQTLDENGHSQLLKESLGLWRKNLSLRQPVMHLFQRPWFSRLWVLQEVAFARDIVAYCGRLQISFKTLIFFGGCLRDVMERDGTADYSVIRALTPVHIMDTALSEPSHQHLMPLIMVSSFQDTSNPRDKVYAVLNRFKPSSSELPKERPLLQPDYSLSLSQVFLKTARAFIEYDQCLDLLSLAQYSQGTAPTVDNELPSWVPVWSRPAAFSPTYQDTVAVRLRACIESNHSLPFPFPIHLMAANPEMRVSELRFSAGLNWSSVLEPRFLDNGRILSLRGVRVDSVTSIAPSLIGDVITRGGRPFYDSLRNWVMKCKLLCKSTQSSSTQQNPMSEAFWQSCLLYQVIFQSKGWTLTNFPKINESIAAATNIPPRNVEEEDQLTNSLSNLCRHFLIELRHS
ncbi:hypothetical protein EV356DRAFT_562657 [Viridothelium virens]|uniref:Heterokaryon incompatibility domain-containing protein n=1 Tax=Viridothelium virens TaxID=1048519 RepID=A0A6A6HPV9_VIRVR|nr:hypothetical protein EV356DRAFT_562657 [Viridothelium virens]